MVQINQKWDKILELVFENPGINYTVREIAKKTGIPSSSVQRYLDKLKKEDLLNEENAGKNTFYFKFLKTFFIINKLHKTRIIELIINELNPSLIILFGSARKGEYDNSSDIDLFVESTSKKELDISKYEKLIGHKIHLLIADDINKININLFNNIINGIKLNGYLSIKK